MISSCIGVQHILGSVMSISCFMSCYYEKVIFMDKKVYHMPSFNACQCCMSNSYTSPHLLMCCVQEMVTARQFFV